MTELNGLTELGGLDLVVQSQEPKRSCRLSIIQGLLIIVVLILGIIAGTYLVDALTTEDQPTAPEVPLVVETPIAEPVEPEVVPITDCSDSSKGHECFCGSTKRPILIDGESVKFGPKTYSPREI